MAQKKELFFAKQFIDFINGTQRKIQQSNHYILLTNVSIKRCINSKNSLCYAIFLISKARGVYGLGLYNPLNTKCTPS